jgi:hypothetical protein
MSALSFKIDIETTINREDGTRISISNWDDGGAWLRIGRCGGDAYTVLTRDEAQQLLEGLQAVLAKEVEA